jgi:hypothetical protein
MRLCVAETRPGGNVCRPLRDFGPTCRLTPDLRPGLMNAVASRLEFAGYAPLLRRGFTSHTHTEKRCGNPKSQGQTVELSLDRTAEGAVPT